MVRVERVTIFPFVGQSNEFLSNVCPRLLQGLTGCEFLKMSYTLQQKSAPECWCHEVGGTVSAANEQIQVRSSLVEDRQDPLALGNRGQHVMFHSV